MVLSDEVKVISKQCAAERLRISEADELLLLNWSSVCWTRHLVRPDTVFIDSATLSVVYMTVWDRGGQLLWANTVTLKAIR